MMLLLIFCLEIDYQIKIQFVSRKTIEAHSLLMSSFHKFCYILVLRVFSYLKPLLIIFCLFIPINSSQN